jgi:protein-glutamine gamma-glutamyltransferase
MKLERMLQVNVAVLTVVGTLLLGLGQGNPMLPALSLFAAVTSIYFTDVMGWFRLHRAVANLAAVGALFISMREFDVFGGDSASQLGAIASLLVYLQFVLLYQEKNQRVYWQLVVLSLLQVVVAAALHLGVEFGAILVVYMFTALSAMSLLFVHHHVEAAQEAQRRQAELAPSLGSPAAWAPTAAPLTSPQVSEREVAASLLGWPFVRRLAATGAATLFLAVVAFYATPRLSDDVWRGAQRTRVVGFHREIRLGEMGELLQSDKPALRLTLLDQLGNRLELRDPPYIRGAALTDYDFDGADGRWGQVESYHPSRLGPLEKPPEDRPWIIALFALEPSRSPVLFSLAPTYGTPHTPGELKYDPVEDQLVRAESLPAHLRRGEYRYETATTMSGANRQPAVWPRRTSLLWMGREVESERRRLRAVPGHLEEIPRLSREIVGEAGAAGDGPYAMAKALEAHFHEPGRYAYTLDQTRTPPRPLNMDPVEHFLVNHRQGHCEYFASALALLLRAQQVPARVVVGYRGGEFNQFGKYYDVRQLHAHAWVEVYLERTDLPVDLQAEVDEEAPAVWLRLDPTPPSFRGGEFHSPSRLAQASSYLESIWNDHVLGLNSSRQQSAVYAPLVERVRQLVTPVQESVRRWTDAAAWRHFLQSFVGAWGIDPPDAKVPWRTIGVVLLLAASLVVLLRTAIRRGYGRRLRRWFSQSRTSASKANPAVGIFFRRVERMLARRRFRRGETQTQREFVREVAGRLAAPQAEAAPLLDRLVDVYYRVRFGGRPLDAAEAQTIENILNQLEQTLAKRPS